jgi:hypothetical protein
LWWCVTQVTKCLPRKNESLISNSCTTKKPPQNSLCSFVPYTDRLVGIHYFNNFEYWSVRMQPSAGCLASPQLLTLSLYADK